MAAASLSLFDWSAPASVVMPTPTGTVLRPYQSEAIASIGAKLGQHRSTLLVMATGTGKTTVFGEVARTWPGRVLVLAHRDELITQARGRLAEMTGEYVGTEQAGLRAQSERLVVGSVQSLRPERLARFAADWASLIVVDEAHHSVAKSYRTVLDHFPGARVLGVTATPDRSDELAMNRVFESLAYVYDIQDGIRDKWLVPVSCQMVQVAGVDLSAVKTTAGDLNQGQLDAVMASEEALHGIAKPTLELAGDRRTILFTTSVDNAHRLAEVLNRYRPGSARAVDGGTAHDLRRATLAAHKRGEFQFLANVGVLTEGYDDPGVACIAMGRPTKSRALYTQCIGRGLRTGPECRCKVGVASQRFPRWCQVCGGSIGYPVPSDVAGRHARIASGPKTDCLVLDFAGNSGRHKLVSALDILAGKWPDEVVARAKKDAERGAKASAEEALEKAARAIEEEKQRAAARRARIKAQKVAYTTRAMDPFEAFGLRSLHDEPQWKREVITPGQVTKLGHLRVDIPPGCTKTQASRLIAAAQARRAKGLASYRQIELLSRYGISASSMYLATASKLIAAIDPYGARRRLTPAEVSRIIQSREPGEDG